MQGIRHARACLRAVEAKDSMFSSFGTIGTLPMKLPEALHWDWFRFQEKLAWVGWLKELTGTKQVVFPRVTRPRNARPLPPSPTPPLSPSVQ